MGKNRLNGRGAISVLGLVVAVALAGCSDLRVTTGIYASLDEASQAGAIAHRWVPANLPPHTTDIREGHLDDRRWGTFAFPPSEGDALRALLQPSEFAGPVQCSPPGRLEWWPRVLLDPIDRETVRTTGLKIYQSRDGQQLFGVNWLQGRAYYWTP